MNILYNFISYTFGYGISPYLQVYVCGGTTVMRKAKPHCPVSVCRSVMSFANLCIAFSQEILAFFDGVRT